MKLSIKLATLFCLGSLAACQSGQLDSTEADAPRFDAVIAGDENISPLSQAHPSLPMGNIKTETPQVVEVGTKPILAIETLDQIHQNYASQYGLELEVVKATWENLLSTKQGKDLSTEEEFNQFLQFVRKTGGDGFAANNQAAGDYNLAAHTSFNEALHHPTLVHLKQLKQKLELQTTEIQKMKDRIVAVAALYHVGMSNAELGQEEFKPWAEDFADRVMTSLGYRYDHFQEDCLHSCYGADCHKSCYLEGKAVKETNSEIRKDLKKLIESSSLYVKDSNVRAGFLSFLTFKILGPEVHVDPASGVKIKNRVYGALSVVVEADDAPYSSGLNDDLYFE